MENRNLFSDNKTYKNRTVDNQKREAIKRANDILNFKVDVRRTTLYRKKETERQENKGFTEGGYNRDSLTVSGIRQAYRNNGENLKGNEMNNRKGDKPNMAEGSKGKGQSNLSDREKITTKLLVALTDNKVGFNLFLKDTEKKIMTMQFYPDTAKALNGELLKKIMRAVESYIREAQRNMEEE